LDGPLKVIVSGIIDTMYDSGNDSLADEVGWVVVVELISYKTNAT